jgi:hypothetical protein
VGPTSRKVIQSRSLPSLGVVEVGYLSRFIPSVNWLGCAPRRFSGLKNALVVGSILGSYSPENRLKFPVKASLLSPRAWLAAPAGWGTKISAESFREHTIAYNCSREVSACDHNCSSLNPAEVRSNWVATLTNPKGTPNVRDWNPWAVSSCSQRPLSSFANERPNYSWKYWRAYAPTTFIPGMEISWYRAYPGLDRTVNLVNNCLRYEMIPENLIYLTDVGFWLHAKDGSNASTLCVQPHYLVRLGSCIFVYKTLRNNILSKYALKKWPFFWCHGLN